MSAAVHRSNIIKDIKMGNKTISPFEKRKNDFIHTSSLRAALNVVAQTMFQHDMYQHYTTLETVLEKISKGEWWLSCCTSDRLNDRKEAVKYGSLKEARTLYQTCFCHGSAESVAMWGLYQRSKPCAVRISLTKRSLRRWMMTLKAKMKKDEQFDRVCFRDLVYLSTDDPDCQGDKFDIKRADSVSWEDVTTQRIASLQDEIAEDWVTGLVKDYEWRHERESRLLVKVRKHTGSSIKIDVPNYVLEDMRFTFSPWLKSNMESLAKKLIKEALAKRLKKDPKQLQPCFRRSVLAGGLNLGDGRVPCAFCDSCKLFGRNECRV